MVKQELIERSPVRFLEKSANGGLAAGEIGVLTSKKGLGKTSVLVQIGLDMLLQEKPVVHVSFNQHSDNVITWYEDIFNETAKKKNLADAEEVKNESDFQTLEKEKDIMRQELLNEGKPADKIENILVGKVRKYYEDVCLENQIFVKSIEKADFVGYDAKCKKKICKFCMCTTKGEKKMAKKILSTVHFQSVSFAAVVG